MKFSNTIQLSPKSCHGKMFYFYIHGLFDITESRDRSYGSWFYVVSSNPAHGEVYFFLRQHYVIKFVSDWRQVDGFLRVLRFPPQIKVTTTI